VSGGYAKPEMAEVSDEMGGRSDLPYVYGSYASTCTAR